jgi:hypothetical protein
MLSVVVLSRRQTIDDIEPVFPLDASAEDVALRGLEYSDVGAGMSRSPTNLRAVVQPTVLPPCPGRKRRRPRYPGGDGQDSNDEGSGRRSGGAVMTRASEDGHIAAFWNR